MASAQNTTQTPTCDKIDPKHIDWDYLITATARCGDNDNDPLKYPEYSVGVVSGGQIRWGQDQQYGRLSSGTIPARIVFEKPGVFPNRVRFKVGVGNELADDETPWDTVSKLVIQAHVDSDVYYGLRVSNIQVSGVIGGPPTSVPCLPMEVGTLPVRGGGGDSDAAGEIAPEQRAAEPGLSGGPAAGGLPPLILTDARRIDLKQPYGQLDVRMTIEMLDNRQSPQPFPSDLPRNSIFVRVFAYGTWPLSTMGKKKVFPPLAWPE